MIEGLIRLMATPNDITGPMNLGNAHPCTILDLAQHIIAATSSHSTLSFHPAPLDDPSHRQPDLTLAEERIGWKTPVELEEGLRRTIEYFRKYSGM